MRSECRREAAHSPSKATWAPSLGLSYPEARRSRAPPVSLRVIFGGPAASPAVVSVVDDVRDICTRGRRGRRPSSTYYLTGIDEPPTAC
jgi:hypothetical protein